MRHAREDYNYIQDVTLFVRLARSIIDSAPDQASPLHRAIAEHAMAEFNGEVSTYTPLIPHNEPVFLLRAQDALALAAVNRWKELAAKTYVSLEMLSKVERHMRAMHMWPVKKMPDLPDVKYNPLEDAARYLYNTGREREWPGFTLPFEDFKKAAPVRYSEFEALVIGLLGTAGLEFKSDD